jgi:DNA-binding IclR family transcriptional regulator
MNASTTLRFLTTLQKKGYVAQEKETLRYYLTFKICTIANNVSSHISLRDISISYLKELSNIFLEPVNLAIEEDMSVVYI